MILYHLERHFLAIASLSSKTFSISLWSELQVLKKQADLKHKVLICPWTELFEELALHTTLSGCEHNT